MADYQHIILEKDPVEHIARLTINRPDRRNALHDDATDEMGQAIDDVAADDDIRVLILTGAGQIELIALAVSPTERVVCVSTATS